MTITQTTALQHANQAGNGHNRSLYEALKALINGDFTLTAAGVTATAAEINAAADVSSRLVTIADGATYTVLAANSGKTHTLPNLTADITIDLPAASAGLEFTFISRAVAADAQDWNIDTGSDTNFYLGGLLYVDDAPAADSAAPDGNSNSIVNVLTPEPGTRVHVVCDGTNWILSGTVASASAPTYADQ